nr:type I pullulanase [uncultured Butyrivibrio sp.]
MKKGAVRGFTAFFAALILTLELFLGGISASITVRADEGVTLKLHYHREDGAYDGWDVWLWPEGGEGDGYPFEDENGEMVATMQVKSGTTKVGFIVRTADWTKDVDMDQFIDISEVISGTVHAYVESGVEGAVKEYGDDIMTGTKLKTVVYDGANTVTAEFTGKLDDALMNSFTLKGRLGEVLITDVSLKEKASDSQYFYDLTIGEELDINRSYRLEFDGQAYQINMPIVYSTKEFEDKYTYEGNDLGASYNKEKTTFRLWAPTAEEAYVNLYESGKAWEKDLIKQLPMTADVNGTWTVTEEGDLAGTYYTYTVILDGLNVEACDPYARTTGVNGKRAMVIDLASTNPEGWDSDTNPHAGEKINDAVIYELHVRDFSVDEAGNIDDKGKFTAFCQTGTKTVAGNATGIDYISNLGVTHVHLLPIYDFGSVDENVPSTEQFNWGYDPVNYNVPEGSYSTDPYDGNVRVKEAKQMVKAFHDNGLSVVMDVVYNHVYSGKDFCINRLVPGYFSRINADGSYSNGSGCGNDTASERSMVRKYIVDSVCYWADEYHIDGFRFDLVGLLDVDTVNEIVSKVHETHPDVIFYGEGWSMNTDVTKENVVMATQQSSEKTPEFAYFNDNMRDGLKGSVFNTSETGWASGSRNKESQMTNSFMAKETWSKNPSQIVQYASCHDNNTLLDRIATARTDLDRDAWIKMSNLSAAFYLTSEGVPFMQAGEEILRTKVKEDGSYDSNSYSSGDAVNMLKWETLDDPKYQENLEYYKGLIAFRKEHGLLRLSDTAEVEARVSAVEGLDKNVVAFTMDNNDHKVSGEEADEIILAFNPNDSATTISLPEGKWSVCVKGTKAGTQALEEVSGSISIEPISSVVLVKGDVLAETQKDNEADNKAATTTESGSDAGTTSKSGVSAGVIAGIVAGIVALAGIIAAVFSKKSRK